MNYFIRNRETGRVELHFSREAWNALPQMTMDVIKCCFYYTGANLWISKPQVSEGEAVSIARELCLTDRGEKGERDAATSENGTVVQTAVDDLFRRRTGV